MIVVRVELWKGGDPKQRVPLALMTVSNDCTGTVTRGNYDVRLHDKKGRAYREGRVEGHARKAESVWKLVRKALGVLVDTPSA